MWRPVSEDSFQYFCNQLKEKGEYFSSHESGQCPSVWFPTLQFYIRFFNNMMNHYWGQCKEGGIHYIQRGAYGLLKQCELLGAHISIEGTKYIEKLHIPPVIVANHMSLLETCFFPLIFAPYFKITYILKESLRNYPLFGRFVQDIDPVFITRKNPRKDMELALDGAKRAIQNGVGIVVFPQGTRTTEFNLRKYSSLPFRMAVAAQTSILPVAVRTDFLGNGKWIKDLGVIHLDRPIHIKILPPLPIDQDIDELRHQSFYAIASCLKEWGFSIQSD